MKELVIIADMVEQLGVNLELLDMDMAIELKRDIINVVNKYRTLTKPKGCIEL
jgi:hypothetical protein